MSDSGPTQIPPSPRPGDQAAPGAKQPDSNVRLVTLPQALREGASSLIAEGRVVRQNEDGTYHIRTDRGDVDVRVTDRRLSLHPGERVEIEIPPGNPPQTARVTPESVQSPQPAPRENLPAPDPNAPPPAPPRSQTTPVDVDLGPPPAAPAGTPSRAAIQQAVRLEHVTPEQAASYIKEAVDIIANNLTNKIQIAAQISELKTEIEISNILDEALNPSTAPPAAPVVTSPAAPLPAPETNPALPPLTQILQALLSENPGPAKPDFTAPDHAQPAITITNPLQPPLQQPQQAQPETGPLVKFLKTVLDLPRALSLTAPQTAPAQTLSPLTTASPDAPFFAAIAKLPTAAAPALPPVSVAKLPLPGEPPLIAPGADPRQTPLEALTEKPLILQNAPPGSLPALVVGTTPQNLPVIHIPSRPAGQNLFILHSKLDGTALPGTQLLLTPLSMPPAQNAHNASPVQALAAGIIALPGLFPALEPWPLLNEINFALQAAAPQAAQALINVTPSPANPGQIPPAALFFIAAVRGGDLSQWLGERTLETLRREGKTDLISRLTREGTGLARLASQPASQDWRPHSLPVFWEGQFYKLPLHTRRESPERNETANTPKSGQVRFVFDLNLSQMGKVQLDGLLRGQRLDLIVRTEQNFSQAAQAEMRRLYANALRETQIGGELSFQNHPDQWVTIAAETERFGVSA